MSDGDERDYVIGVYDAYFDYVEVDLYGEKYVLIQNGEVADYEILATVMEFGFTVDMDPETEKVTSISGWSGTKFKVSADCYMAIALATTGGDDNIGA